MKTLLAAVVLSVTCHFSVSSVNADEALVDILVDASASMIPYQDEFISDLSQVVAPAGTQFMVTRWDWELMWNTARPWPAHTTFSMKRVMKYGDTKLGHVLQTVMQTQRGRGGCPRIIFVINNVTDDPETYRAVMSTMRGDEFVAVLTVESNPVRAQATADWYNAVPSFAAPAHRALPFTTTNMRLVMEMARDHKCAPLMTKLEKGE
jgi:hypothetical protein